MDEQRAQMRIRQLRRLDQADLSNNLVHFTGRIGRMNRDVPREIQELDAKARLLAILESRTIRAFPVFGQWGDPVVCFTEATLEGMRSLVKDSRYVPWGIEFSKDFIFRQGGGPTYYVRGDDWDAFTRSDIPNRSKALGTKYWPGVDWEGAGWREVNPTLESANEWAHEREWRIPIAVSGSDAPVLTFRYADVTSLVAPTTALGQELKDHLTLDVYGEVMHTPILALEQPSEPEWRELTLRLQPLDYTNAIAMFTRVEKVLTAHKGEMRVVLEMPHSGGGVRRIPTPFFVRPSRELVAEIRREVADALEGIALTG